jgi:uncharacterized membrane protein YhaH (DUF805 family)
MDFNAVIENFKNVLAHHYFDFKGRARRSAFWYFWLVIIAIDIILYFLELLSSLFGIVG